MGATAVLRAALAAAFATAAPASSRGALACLRSCADSLAYPPDARAHFDEIHRALDNYSHVSYARLAGYRGPWIENRWIAATRADLARADAAGGSLRDVAGPFVPLLVPWLDEWLAPRMWHYPPGMVEKLLGLLRPGVAYVTVSQTNCGVTGDFTRERLGPFVADALPDALPAGRPFPKQFRRGYYWPNKRPPWAFQVWWATWEKVRRCFALVEDFERSTLRRRYDIVARLRPDLWFFGAPPPLAAIFPPSAPRGVAFAAGVVGSFRRAEAANDHVAWASHDAAPEYFRLVDALAAGDDFTEMLDYGGTWLLWRMRNRSVPVAAPTPLAPYTVARACDGAAPGLAVAVECYHWRVDEARRTASPPLAVRDLRAAYDACVSRWDEERAARPASTCAAIDDAPAYNTWSFPARGDAAA